MKKDFIVHFTFFLAFFILITLFKGWFDLKYIPFWVGGILGLILPDIDYLLNVYLLNPNDASSQNIASLFAQRKIKEGIKLALSVEDRTNLIIHNVPFQLIFLIFSFLIVSSSTSLLARGLVLGFLLHLLLDEVTDLIDKKELEGWFRKVPFVLDGQQRRWYLVLNLVLLLVLGFLL